MDELFKDFEKQNDIVIYILILTNKIKSAKIS